jgi:hypothetical protein
MTKELIDEATLLGDCIEGIKYYGKGKIDNYRAKVLAKTNLMFIAEEMYEAQDAAMLDIATKEIKRKEK